MAAGNEQHDSSLVLQVDAGYIDTIINESGAYEDREITDEDLSKIADHLGDRWVSTGFYERVSEEIIEVAEETLG